jgi:hypothetical protein
VIYNFGSGPVAYVDNYYLANGQLDNSYQVNTDSSLVYTNYNTSTGDWTKSVTDTNASGQETEYDLDFTDGSYEAKIYNLSGGPIASTENYYLANGQLDNTTQINTDGSSTYTNYNTSVGSSFAWTEGVTYYNPSGQETSESVYYTDGSQTITPESLSTTLTGGSGYNSYEFDSSFGQDTINNGGGSAAHGEIDFASGTTDENLWFVHSGNNLVIDLLGTTDQITVSGWFNGTAGNQVQSFHAGGLTLDTQFAQLVQAMASYGAANTGFNPQTATAMPTNSALQTEIAAAWHS